MADVAFEPFAVPGARSFFGNALPYGLRAQPTNNPDSSPPIDASASALRKLAESGTITELLQKHGALLISGLGHPSAQSFSELIHAVEGGRGSTPFVQIGLAGKRSEVAKAVWTANEGPPDRRFYQHNEYSRYTRFPANIHFYCEKKAPKGERIRNSLSDEEHISLTSLLNNPLLEALVLMIHLLTLSGPGGESPIAHSAYIYEKVSAEIPELVEGVKQKGLGMKMVFRAPGNEGEGNGFNWAGIHSFGQELEPGDSDATIKEKVEKQVRKLTDDFQWLDDGSIELTQHIPGLRRDPSNNRPIWFNGLVGRHGITRDIGALEPPHVGRDGMTYPPSVYGDGTPIPREYLDKLIDVIDEGELRIALAEGDLLLVDNFQVSHGRIPWEGERKVLVSMWDGAEPVKAF